jgi:hypothetical protein
MLFFVINDGDILFGDSNVAFIKRKFPVNEHNIGGRDRKILCSTIAMSRSTAAMLHSAKAMSSNGNAMWNSTTANVQSFLRLSVVIRHCKLPVKMFVE